MTGFFRNPVALHQEHRMRRKALNASFYRDLEEELRYELGFVASILCGVAANRNNPAEHQERITGHFDSASLHWRDLYRESTLEGMIHQHRLSLVLSWVDELGAPKNGARALDVGCGAGVIAIALAKRGYDLRGIDPSPSMVELAQAEVGTAGVSDCVVITTGDAHSLDLVDESCDVVVALGVIPYLHSPRQAVTEIARVLKPGGFAILSSDNVFRLSHVLDPRCAPFPGREALKLAIHRVRRRPAEGLEWHLLSLRYVKMLLHSAGLQVQRSATFGYGPFTFFGKRIFSKEREIAIHRRLQDLADRRTPVVTAVGAQHLLLACKPELATRDL